jgi:5'-nucleotidase
MSDQFWARSTELLTRLLEQLLSQRPEPHRFWNVNLPDWHDPQLATNGGPRLVHCPLDPSPFPGEYRRLENAFHFVNDYHGRPRRADHDIDVCFRGDVAITLI